MAGAARRRRIGPQNAITWPSALIAGSHTAPDLADRGRRDGGDHMALLIVDSDAVAAVLDDDHAAVAGDRGRAAGDELDRLLVVRYRRDRCCR